MFAVVAGGSGTFLDFSYCWCLKNTAKKDTSGFLYIVNLYSEISTYIINKAMFLIRLTHSLSEAHTCGGKKSKLYPRRDFPLSTSAIFLSDIVALWKGGLRWLVDGVGFGDQLFLLLPLHQPVALLWAGRGSAIVGTCALVHAKFPSFPHDDMLLVSWSLLFVKLIFASGISEDHSILFSVTSFHNICSGEVRLD